MQPSHLKPLHITHTQMYVKLRVTSEQQRNREHVKSSKKKYVQRHPQKREPKEKLAHQFSSPYKEYRK